MKTTVNCDPPRRRPAPPPAPHRLDHAVSMWYRHNDPTATIVTTTATTCDDEQPELKDVMLQVLAELRAIRATRDPILSRRCS